LQQRADLAAATAARPHRDRARRLRHALVASSLRTRVAVAILLVSILAAGTFALLLVALSDLRSATDAQARARDVTAATIELQRVVNELELSLRAYVVTGNPRFLASWRQARLALRPAIAKVEPLVASQPAERDDLGEVATLASGYVSEYGDPLIAIARLDPAAARAPVAAHEGVSRVGAILGALTRLLAHENALAAARSSAARNAANRAVALGTGAVLAIVALLGLFGLLLLRGVALPVRSVADGAIRVAGGDLSTRLPERGAAEIRRLTTAFNAMARSLAQSKRELEAQNEQLRQSERLKSELVGIVSHELRTPLAGIIGYASLLRRASPGDPETRRYAETIEAQGKRLASLVESFLDLEAVEAGRIALADEPLDLEPLLRHEAQLVGADAPRHRVEVTVDAPALPVRGDRDRLAQVCTNLLANAVKYSPEGGRIDVVGEIVGQAVRVRVRDEGIGIPLEHQPRIFTKFFRGEAREGGFSGSGLGLALSREIVEAHGGRIGFESEPGAGSTFWFELPLARGSEKRRGERA